MYKWNYVDNGILNISPVESCFTEYIFFSETFCSWELNYFLDNFKLSIVTRTEDEVSKELLTTPAF